MHLTANHPTTSITLPSDPLERPIRAFREHRDRTTRAPSSRSILLMLRTYIALSGFILLAAALGAVRHVVRLAS